MEHPQADSAAVAAPDCDRDRDRDPAPGAGDVFAYYYCNGDTKELVRGGEHTHRDHKPVFPLALSLFPLQGFPKRGFIPMARVPAAAASAGEQPQRFLVPPHFTPVYSGLFTGDPDAAASARKERRSCGVDATAKRGRGRRHEGGTSSQENHAAADDSKTGDSGFFGLKDFASASIVGVGVPRPSWSEGEEERERDISRGYESEDMRGLELSSDEEQGDGQEDALSFLDAPETLTQRLARLGQDVYPNLDYRYGYWYNLRPRNDRGLVAGKHNARPIQLIKILVQWLGTSTASLYSIHTRHKAVLLTCGRGKIRFLFVLLVRDYEKGCFVELSRLDWRPPCLEWGNPKVSNLAIEMSIFP